jgi:hypothetical protein
MWIKISGSPAPSTADKSGIICTGRGRLPACRPLLRFAESKIKGHKALLAAALPEGIDLTRDRDLGRDMVL